MTERLINVAREELLRPTLEVTQQYLNVCELQMIDGLPRVVRIEENDPEIAWIYFAVKDEPYYIVVSVFRHPEPRLNFVDTQSGHRVYLTATSKSLSFQELSALTTLRPLTGWSVGERPNFKGKPGDHSRISYEPIRNESYSLEEKLDLLLPDLEADTGGVIRLTESAKTYISVCRYQYIDGNSGIGLNKETITRLHKLNLSIDIDQYIIGKPLKT